MDLIRDIALKWHRSVVVVERNPSVFLPPWTTYLWRKVFWVNLKVVLWHNVVLNSYLVHNFIASYCLLSHADKMSRIHLRWRNWTTNKVLQGILKRVVRKISALFSSFFCRSALLPLCHIKALARVQLRHLRYIRDIKQCNSRRRPGGRPPGAPESGSRTTPFGGKNKTKQT